MQLHYVASSAVLHVHVPVESVESLLVYGVAFSSLFPHTGLHANIKNSIDYTKNRKNVLHINIWYKRQNKYLFRRMYTVQYICMVFYYHLSIDFPYGEPVTSL